MIITEAIRQFMEHAEIEEGKSDLTLRNYSHYLDTFAKFCDEEKISEPGQITNELVRLYRLWLNRAFKHVKTGNYVERGRKTQNYYLIALRGFLKYLMSRDIVTLPPEKIILAKQGEREITILTPEELERIMAAPEDDKLHGRRDRALMELLYSTGLRVSELIGLDREDVRLDTGEFSVKGKGRKVRVVFLSQEATEAIRRYLLLRRDEDPALFIRLKVHEEAKSDDGKKSIDSSARLTARSVQRIISYYATKVGIAKQVTPHVFRHVFATDLLQNGADLRSVQALLGHSSITSTQIYTHVTNPQLQDVHKAFHARQRAVGGERGAENSKPNLETEPDGLGTAPRAPLPANRL